LFVITTWDDLSKESKDDLLRGKTRASQDGTIISVPIPGSVIVKGQILSKLATTDAFDEVKSFKIHDKTTCKRPKRPTCHKDSLHANWAAKPVKLSMTKFRYNYAKGSGDSLRLHNGLFAQEDKIG